MNRNERYLLNGESLKYRAWYYFYKVSNKLGLWRMYSGYDEEFGIPFVTSYWFWQSKPQDVVILGQEADSDS